MFTGDRVWRRTRSRLPVNYLTQILHDSTAPNNLAGFSGKTLEQSLTRKAYVALVDTMGTQTLTDSDLATVYQTILKGRMLPCLGVVDNKPVSWFLKDESTAKYHSVISRLPNLSNEDPLVEHTMRSLRQVKAFRLFSDSKAVDELIDTVAKKLATLMMQRAIHGRRSTHLA